jgi:hypothetical protein
MNLELISALKYMIDSRDCIIQRGPYEEHAFDVVELGTDLDISKEASMGTS